MSGLTATLDDEFLFNEVLFVECTGFLATLSCLLVSSSVACLFLEAVVEPSTRRASSSFFLRINKFKLF